MCLGERQEVLLHSQDRRENYTILRLLDKEIGLLVRVWEKIFAIYVSHVRIGQLTLKRLRFKQVEKEESKSLPIGSMPTTAGAVSAKVRSQELSREPPREWQKSNTLSHYCYLPGSTFSKMQKPELEKSPICTGTRWILSTRSNACLKQWYGKSNLRLEEAHEIHWFGPASITAGRTQHSINPQWANF